MKWIYIRMNHISYEMKSYLVKEIVFPKFIQIIILFMS